MSKHKELSWEERSRKHAIYPTGWVDKNITDVNFSMVSVKFTLDWLKSTGKFENRVTAEQFPKLNPSAGKYLQLLME